jgi:tetratricopeptide (TPR) repeat protein
MAKPHPDLISSVGILRTQAEEALGWRPVLHALLIALAASAVYANTLHNAFHLDDFYRLVDNPGIRRVAPAWRHFLDPSTSSTDPWLVQYRPFLPLTLSLNYYLAGDSLPGYHLANLLFQIVASILVYFLVLELLRHWSVQRLAPDREEIVALVVAVLFAIHPVSGILVNYIAGRDLLLMQLFVTASLLAYMRMRRMGASVLRWIGVLGLFTLATLSKTNTVVVPLLILGFEWTLGKESFRSAPPWLRALPFALVIVGFFLFTRVALEFSDAENVFYRGRASRWEHPLTQAKLHLFHYLRNFIWPFPIRQLPYVEAARSLLDARVLAGLAFISATILAAWRLRATFPLLAFCILGYWTMMLIESSFLTLHHFAVDYRPYPSSVFLFLALVLLAERFLSPRVSGPLFVAFVIYFGAASIWLNRTWRTEESLWSHSVRHGGSEVAHLYLAMSIADRQDVRVENHLREAIRLRPGYIRARTELALLLAEGGRKAEGLYHIKTAVAMNPEDPSSYYGLSQVYSALGQHREAAAASAQASRLAPGNALYRAKALKDAQRASGEASTGA